MSHVELNSHQNSLLLKTTGTIFAIVKDDGEKVKLITVSEEGDQSKFVALFDQQDVDFNIRVDNSASHDRGVGFSVIINEKWFDFYVAPNDKMTLQALEHRGRKLHFKSQDTEEGKLLVQGAAEKYQKSLSEAAEMCSKIEFRVEIEMPKRPRMAKSSYTDFSLSDNCVSDSAGPAIFGAGLSRIENDSMPLPAAAGNRQREATALAARPAAVGTRGVVCLGQQTTQNLAPYFGFQRDYNINIRPFVIELRMAKYQVV